MTHEQITECFGYLDLLRKSGRTNMFGATPYLAKAKRLKDDVASKVLVAWMRSFSTEKTPAERASGIEI